MLQAAMDSASVQANRISTRSNTDNTFIILGIQRVGDDSPALFLGKLTILSALVQKFDLLFEPVIP
jgi:hypothetical protein